MISSHLGLGTFALKGMPQTDKWTVSPVCSRLRDHITMMSGNSFKDRLFLQSPMTNKLNWGLTSPQIDPYRYTHMGSTAHNTSANSKYGYPIGTYEGFSE